MSKLLCCILILVIWLILSPNIAYAAPKCEEKFGVTYIVDPPSPIPEGTSSIKVTFSGGITPGYYYRLEFDSTTTDYVQATTNSVEIPIANSTDPTINTKLQKGTHVSTLRYSRDGQERSQDLCGFIEYTVGFKFKLNDCRLSFSSLSPADNQQITVTATTTPQGSYAIILRGRNVGDINVGPTGEGSATIGPISQIGPAPVSLVVGYRLPGQIVFCGSDSLNIRASGGIAPPIGCTIIPPSTPGAEARILATNLQQNTFYHARLDNTFTSQQNTDTNVSLELSLGSNISPGPHTGSIHNLSGQNLCPAGSGSFTIAGTGIVTPSAPAATPCTDPTKCTLAGGTPCGDLNNPGFKTAIGCIHTSPIEFTKDFLKFIVAIGGGFAFLMMLLGAFQMLTSAGNPETLQAGRERLTSAVIGLLLVIFATLLMQIIGFDILGLPGFGR